MPVRIPISSTRTSDLHGSTLNTSRLLMPEALEADENMALDEVLIEGHQWVLRKTTWLSPAVTLGRFQVIADVAPDRVIRSAVNGA